MTDVSLGFRRLDCSAARFAPTRVLASRRAIAAVIATRNGVLVSRHEHLLRDEGAGLREAMVHGSSERLAPVLLSALTAGLAPVPLVLAGDHPGNDIQGPMAEVILGGLLTSTVLNLVVVPVLFDVGAVRPGSRPRRPSAPR